MWLYEIYGVTGSPQDAEYRISNTEVANILRGVSAISASAVSFGECPGAELTRRQAYNGKSDRWKPHECGRRKYHSVGK